jgi:hypothetical protein
MNGNHFFAMSVADIDPGGETIDRRINVADN